MAKLVLQVHFIPPSTSTNERITSFRPSQHLLQSKQKNVWKSVKFKVQTICTFHTDCPFWLIFSLKCQSFSGLSAYSKKSLATGPKSVRMAFYWQKSRIQTFTKNTKFWKSRKEVCINFYCSKNYGHFSLWSVNNIYPDF